MKSVYKELKPVKFSVHNFAEITAASKLYNHLSTGCKRPHYYKTYFNQRDKIFRMVKSNPHITGSYGPNNNAWESSFDSVLVPLTSKLER